MRLKDLGEFEIIEKIKRKARFNKGVFLGPGDDCAVLEFDSKRFQLFTCDMIIEDVDFRLREDPYLIGRKAIGVSLSDIASSCGIPTHCLVSAGLSKNTGVKYFDRILKGMFDIAGEFKVNIVGGDLSSSRKLVIDVSMLGLVEKNRIALRSGARKGDYIFMTGEFGDNSSGKHFKFIPRIKEARFLAENFKVNSMIDISDGLIQDLRHILKSSSCGAFIYEDLLPLSPKARSLSSALTNGEEFELIFTLPRREGLKLIKKRIVNFSLIGEITDRKFGFNLVESSGKIRKIGFDNLLLSGYSHFK